MNIKFYEDVCIVKRLVEAIAVESGKYPATKVIIEWNDNECDIIIKTEQNYETINLVFTVYYDEDAALVEVHDVKLPFMFYSSLSRENQMLCAEMYVTICQTLETLNYVFPED